jgi:hypothetical protein
VTSRRSFCFTLSAIELGFSIIAEYESSDEGNPLYEKPLDPYSVLGSRLQSAIRGSNA